ncbi:uncharacterized protein LOC119461724 [Dermacentor silvarum]|uniref:uncharacterized protein LOC119461724 n=1 Tax=Dermacentor silvarum TaxID=543639 RepID=UPI00189C47AB|nr:uncharacterized protein LOC119461724 [Dermacentor silvarum]
MQSSSTFSLVLLLPATLVMGELGPPGGPLNLDHKLYDAADIIKLISTFDYLVAISDADNDTIFECMSAKRVEFDPEVLSATYLWVFPSTGVEVPIYIHLGGPLGKVQFTIPQDKIPREGIVYYSNYKNCVVVEAELYGQQCVLWTSTDVKDNVPQDCIDNFVDTCGVIVPKHSRDLCPDGEGDY